MNLPAENTLICEANSNAIFEARGEYIVVKKGIYGGFLKLGYP